MGLQRGCFGGGRKYDNVPPGHIGGDSCTLYLSQQQEGGNESYSSAPRLRVSGKGGGPDMSGATLVVALVMQISQWGGIHTPSLVGRPTPAIRMRPGGGRMQESVEICGLSDVY